MGWVSRILWRNALLAILGMAIWKLWAGLSLATGTSTTGECISASLLTTASTTIPQKTQPSFCTPHPHPQTNPKYCNNKLDTT